MRSINLFKISVFAFITVILCACTIEQKLASSFVFEKNKGAVLVLSPELIYKTNLRDSLSVDSKSLSQSTIDSIPLESSVYLKYINEKNFVDLSIDHLKDELIRMGFQVYDEDSFDDFMLAKDSSYILKLSQVEIEEGFGARIQTDYLYNELVAVSVDVNFININTWFELERKNITDENFPLLYKSFSMMDGVQGQFALDNRGVARYSYVKDTLMLKDFVDFPEFLGKKYASNFYDYILNIDIIESLPADKAPSYFFHYNPRTKRVAPILDDDYFEEIVE